MMLRPAVGESVAVHGVAMEPEHMARLPPLVANSKALAVVIQARERVLAVSCKSEL